VPEKVEGRARKEEREEKGKLMGRRGEKYKERGGNKKVSGSGTEKNKVKEGGSN
jgi:hypothetical protein